MKTIAITIGEDMLRRIDEITEGSSSAGNRSQFIREAVSERLRRIDRISEEEREKDRDAVRKIPEFLGHTGFGIYRAEAGLKDEASD